MRQGNLKREQFSAPALTLAFRLATLLLTFCDKAKGQSGFSLIYFMQGAYQITIMSVHCKSPGVQTSTNMMCHNLRNSSTVPSIVLICQLAILEVR